MRSKTGLRQWRNTDSVIDWFVNLDRKKKLKFIQFDIESFYPSISKKVLLKSINFCKKFHDISDLDIDIIMEARKTFLVSNGQKWVKKENPEIDVTLGAYDGAEISENVGLYLLSEIDKIEGIEAGLYGDDG